MILSICIVLYNSNSADVAETLETLLAAIEYGHLNVSSKLYIVDNSEVLSLVPENYPIFSEVPFEIIHGQGNVGFGRGHNCVLQREIGTYHLVLNPDVQLDPISLTAAIQFMSAELECGLLSPAAIYPDGSKQYLCKRYPSVFDLLLRGFAPQKIRRIFDERLAQYQMQSATQSNVFWDPPIVSGCFMFFRGDVFRKLRGFDPAYMLYFEDFDISLRSAELARTAYVPTVKIVHKGGNAARKGFWHVRQFMRSAQIFFRSHGLKIF